MRKVEGEELVNHRSCFDNEELTSVNIRRTARSIVESRLFFLIAMDSVAAEFMCRPAGWSPTRHATPFEENWGNSMSIFRALRPFLRSHEQRKHQVDFLSVFHPWVRPILTR